MHFRAKGLSVLFLL